MPGKMLASVVEVSIQHPGSASTEALSMAAMYSLAHLRISRNLLLDNDGSVSRLLRMSKKELIMAQMTTKSAPFSKHASPSNAAVSRSGELSRDTIAALAHQKWHERGCPIGDDHRDWFEAEKELRSTSTGQRQAK